MQRINIKLQFESISNSNRRSLTSFIKKWLLIQCMTASHNIMLTYMLSHLHAVQVFFAPSLPGCLTIGLVNIITQGILFLHGPGGSKLGRVSLYNTKMCNHSYIMHVGALFLLAVVDSHCERTGAIVAIA